MTAGDAPRVEQCEQGTNEPVPVVHGAAEVRQAPREVTFEAVDAEKEIWSELREKAVQELGWAEGDSPAVVPPASNTVQSSGLFDRVQHHHEDGHETTSCKQWLREYVKPIVFGGLDGIITTFAVVAAAFGADGSLDVVKTVLILGFANLLADGASMGFGEYLGSKAEADGARAVRREARRRVRHAPLQALARLARIFKGRMSDADAVAVVLAVSRDENAFTAATVAAEDDVVAPVDADDEGEDGGDCDSLKSALAMFLSFVVFGMVPLFPWLPQQGGAVTFGISCAMVALTLFILGAVRGRLTKQWWVSAGGIMVLNGCFVAGLSYLVGWGLAEVVGDTSDSETAVPSAAPSV